MTDQRLLFRRQAGEVWGERYADLIRVNGSARKASYKRHGGKALWLTREWALV